jgi:hypothetical protein
MSLIASPQKIIAAPELIETMKVYHHMHMDLKHVQNLIETEFSPAHAELYSLIAREDQVMSTYGLECATEMDPDELATCLGDLVRASYIRVFNKHNRRPAWEIVKDIAKAS